ncbi:nitronate monooxygenase [Nocardia transvalensis]|uniref:nitronate monooxygenase n=1 Tax=Nocardia transvalensis TaxID=37333 RepID=UPI001892D9EE|nr:nitronate monooxygenase [Nocardia transvalensis]MBF6329232.1 nitronate monooxygenase [Nocardia transvalensis]
MDLLDRLRLDVPVAQAGMGGRLAGARLAAAVAAAGGLGTLGLLPSGELRVAIGQVREQAPGRAVAVNLLMPFVKRRHVQVCIEAGVDVVVVAFGGDAALVRELRGAGIFVFVMVGTEDQARTAVSWGADGLIAQGREAGGHLVGEVAALEFLPRAITIAQGRPVLLAGGIATADDTAAALAAEASGVVAGTRFLMTEESAAHPDYQRRVIAARNTMVTTLFGLSWPTPHRVIPNEATDRWCHPDGTPRRLPAMLNSRTEFLARLAPENGDRVLPALQHPRLPFFSPAAPLADMPPTHVDRTALYAGESARRITAIVPARLAVAELAGQVSG